MFDEEAKEKVKKAIEDETRGAIECWGETYSSMHEGYAVLKEEVEEAEECSKIINNKLDMLWNCIKRGNGDKAFIVSEIRGYAEQMALEAIQIAAVCNKIDATGLQMG